MSDDVPLMPLRMVNEYLYCPRLFYIMHVQGDFIESSDTIMGRFEHRNVDIESMKKLIPGVLEDGKTRSVKLSSERIGIVAVIDIVEARDGKVIPVEYKLGKAPKHVLAWENDMVQSVGQALLLRDNGFSCDTARIFYKGSMKYVDIRVDEDAEAMTLGAISDSMRCAEGEMPPPLDGSNKCIRCSLAPSCLPDETMLLTSVEDEKEIRRLYPARDDLVPVYVKEQGARVSKDHDELLIGVGGETTRVRLMEISSLSLYGGVSITSPAISELLERGIPILHLSSSGWFRGMTTGLPHKNVLLRLAQYGFHCDEDRSLAVSRNMIGGKVKNCRTMLRRLGDGGGVDHLADVLKEIQRAETAETLRGLEGMAARIYFMHFPGMIKRDEVEYSFEGRNRRPPTDPINSMLSYLYSVMAKDFTVWLTAVGLDPYLGFFHRPRYGRPSLALDLMEEFRPIIADSVVIRMVNNGECSPKDFVRRGEGVEMAGALRRKLVQEYEKRMDALITHPLFGYRVSYRRTVEVQARLLSRHVLGEIGTYTPITTR